MNKLKVAYKSLPS